MGVYIPNMEMPESCNGCGLKFFVFEPEVKVLCTVLKREIPKLKRDEVPDDCPLISVPRHVRLIDADALMDVLTRAKEDDPLQYKEDYFTVSDWLWVTPTIIEAEPCNDLSKPNKRKDGE